MKKIIHTRKLLIQIHLCMSFAWTTIVFGQNMESRMFVSPREINNSEVIRLIESENGWLWIVAKNDLYRSDGNQTVSILRPSSLDGGHVGSVIQDANFIDKSQIAIQYYDKPFVILVDINSGETKVVNFPKGTDYTLLNRYIGEERYFLGCSESQTNMYYLNDEYEVEMIASYQKCNTEKIVRFIAIGKNDFICSDKEGIYSGVDCEYISSEFPYNYSFYGRNGLGYISNMEDSSINTYDFGTKELKLTHQCDSSLMFNHIVFDNHHNQILGFSEKDNSYRYTHNLLLYSDIDEQAIDLSSHLNDMGLQGKIHVIGGADFNKKIFIGGRGVVSLEEPVDRFKKVLQRPGISELEYGTFVREMIDLGDNILIAGEVRCFYKLNLKSGQVDTFRLLDEGGDFHRISKTNVLLRDNDLVFTSTGSYLSENPSGHLIGFDLNTGLILHKVEIPSLGGILFKWGSSIYYTDFSRNGLYTYNLESKEICYLHPFNNLIVADIDSTNSLGWLGAYDGLFWLDLNTKELHETSFNHIVNCIEIIDENNYLLGTTIGVVRYDLSSDKWEVLVNQESGLSSNNVVSLERDNAGDLWIGTENGLNYYQTKNALVVNYTTEDGLAHNNFLRFASTKDEEGNLYFGGMNGLSIVKDPTLYQGKHSQIKLRSMLTTLLGAKIESKDRQIENNQEEIVVPHNYLSLALNVFSEDCPFSNRVNFAYAIDGLFHNYRPVVNNEIYIEKLPAGQYTIFIKSSGCDGFWDDKVKELTLTVDPVFYKTIWFLLLVYALFAGAIGAVFIYQLRKFKRRHIYKLELKKKMNALEVQALRSQLNPHFIFNALGSIQYYIQTKKIALADKYLADFAMLMRLYLESSKRTQLHFTQEIKLIKTYTKLEELRFEDKFKTIVEIDDSLDTDGLMIPSMILQPFVENAIKHGFTNSKNNDGKLVISFENIEDKDLVVRIDDNGIGREMSSKYSSHEGFKSRGMELLNDRIDIVQQNDGIRIEYSIEDKVDHLGNAAGTRIVVTMFEILK